MYRLPVVVTIIIDDAGLEQYAKDHDMAWWNGSPNHGECSHSMRSTIRRVLEDSELDEYASFAIGGSQTFQHE